MEGGKRQFESDSHCPSIVSPGLDAGLSQAGLSCWGTARDAVLDCGVFFCFFCGRVSDRWGGRWGAGLCWCWCWCCCATARRAYGFLPVVSASPAERDPRSQCPTVSPVSSWSRDLSSFAKCKLGVVEGRGMTTRKGRYPGVYGQTWARRPASVSVPRDSFGVGREWRGRMEGEMEASESSDRRKSDRSWLWGRCSKLWPPAAVT